VLIFTLLLFIEWPLSDALRSPALLGVAVIGRTALFIWLAVLTGRQLWPAPRAAAT
jgi:hypothetical protein